MTPEKEFNNNVRYVIDKIKKKYLYATKEKYIIEYEIAYGIEFCNFFDSEDNIVATITSPVPEEESKILEILRDRGVITIISKSHSSNKGDGSVWAEIFELEVMQSEFNKIYNKYKKKFNESNADKTIIYISGKDGIYKDLNNKKLNYPIGSRTKRLKIIRHLINGKKDGKILADSFYRGNLQQVSKEIKEINRIFMIDLKLKNYLIIHVTTGGYKLNDDNYIIKCVDQNP